MERDIFHIASAYFGGRISDSDREYLEGWLKQSPENQKIFLELENVWKLTGNLKGSLKPDIHEEWQKFVQNREKEEYETQPARNFWRSPAWRVAAILIPGIFLSFALLYFFKHNSSEEWIVIAAGEEKTEKLLPDGSEVWINRHSSISFPKNFNDNRYVKLTGEAFFEVAKNKGIFTVSTNSSEIKVLGTQFNVRANESEHTNEVIVKEGRVSFASKTNTNINVILTAGEKGLLNTSTNELKKEVSDDANLCAWMTQKLIFKETRLSKIKVDVSRYFNKIVWMDSSLNNNTFTGTFLNPDIDEVMRVISMSINGSFETKGDTIFIKGK